MKRKSVLIDLRYLAYTNGGFGQLSLNYGNYVKNNPDKIADLDITLFVPKDYIGEFGSHVKYLECKRIYKKHPFLLPYFDIWHSTSQQAKYIAIGSRTTRIITIHDLNFLYENSPKRAKRKLKRQQFILDTADILTAISNFTIGDLKKHIKLRGKSVILNYVGERSIAQDPEIKPNFVKTNRQFFFTIGQVVEKKNFHVLLDMMKLMPNYDLYICGDNNYEYAKYIEKRIIDEDIKNVFVTGIISPEEKVWMYRNCTAFTFPSKFEGFGYPLIEAMLFGKPVFSSSCTSLPEIGDKYAFFWNNFDPEHMKELIESNLDNYYNNKEFINEEIKYANSFTIDRHMGAYLDLYRQVEIKKRENLFLSIYNYYRYLRS